MGILDEMLEGKKSIVILGHVNPDGDCIGSCLGLWNYLRENYEGIEVTVCLEPMPQKFDYLKGYHEVCHEYDPEKKFDLCITLDASDVPRLGGFAGYLKSAAKSLCVDHHITNEGLADVNVIDAKASSTCEVLFGLMEEEKISLKTAECLYTGIVHDTGVFKYSSASKRTMEIAGCLMEKGVKFQEIIDGSFYRRTYGQNRLLGNTVLKSELLLSGLLVWSYVTKEELDRFGCTVKAVDGIIDQLRVTEGADCAVLIYETGENRECKVSLRSNHMTDVSRIAAGFGGGGHVRAAGCTMYGEIPELIKKVADAVAVQLEGR